MHHMYMYIFLSQNTAALLLHVKLCIIYILQALKSGHYTGTNVELFMRFSKTGGKTDTAIRRLLLKRMQSRLFKKYYIEKAFL